MCVILLACFSYGILTYFFFFQMLINYQAAPYKVQPVWCLLTMSGSLLLLHIQIVLDGSVCMGECHPFTVSQRWRCVNAICWFHWLSGPRGDCKHMYVATAIHPLGYCRMALRGGVSGPLQGLKVIWSLCAWGSLAVYTLLMIIINI